MSTTDGYAVWRDRITVGTALVSIAVKRLALTGIEAVTLVLKSEFRYSPDGEDQVFFDGFYLHFDGTER